MDIRIKFFNFDNPPPDAPQNLIVTDSSNQTITIKWRKNTEADFQRYRIFRGTSPNPNMQIDSTTGGLVIQQKRLQDLLTETRYYLRVAAVRYCR